MRFGVQLTVRHDALSPPFSFAQSVLGISNAKLGCRMHGAGAGVGLSA